MMRFLFLLFVLDCQGCEAAWAAGRQLTGGEDGEQDADSGERYRHGQHHLPELHGFSGGDCKGENHEYKHNQTNNFFIKLIFFAWLHPFNLSPHRTESSWVLLLLSQWWKPLLNLYFLCSDGVKLKQAPIYHLFSKCWDFICYGVIHHCSSLCPSHHFWHMNAAVSAELQWNKAHSSHLIICVFIYSRNGQRRCSTWRLTSWCKTCPERPASKKRMLSTRAHTCTFRRCKSKIHQDKYENQVCRHHRHASHHEGHSRFMFCVTTGREEKQMTHLL